MKTRLRTIIAAIAFAILATAGTASAASAPPLGASAEDVDLRGVPGTEPYGTGYAVPLQASKPDWYTPELRERVLAADGGYVEAPAGAPLPSEVGIRPGAWMVDPAGCTMNFIFQSGSKLGIGTAGHCAEVGDDVVLLTTLPNNPGQSGLVNVGRVVLSHDNGVGDDFALVEIKPELHSDVDPTTALIGGPCGQYTGSGPETVAHYGHGLAIGTGGTPRVGIALTWFDDAYGWDGAAIFGDSGSPVRVTDLKAAGNLTHLVVNPRFLPSFIAGTRITKILEISGSWTLLDSDLCPTGSGGGDGGTTESEEKGNGNGGGNGQGKGPKPK